jgi:hypothetical protein
MIFRGLMSEDRYANSASTNELPSRRTSHTLVFRMLANIYSKNTIFGRQMAG